jgi:hypothetical protein
LGESCAGNNECESNCCGFPFGCSPTVSCA